MDGSHLKILFLPVQGKCAYEFTLQTVFGISAELVEWIDSHGPAPLPELTSWPSPLPTTPPPDDNVTAPSTRDNSTYLTNSSSLPNRQLFLPTMTDALDASQTAPATELISPHSLHTSSFETSDSSTDFAIKLLRPQLTQGGVL